MKYLIFIIAISLSINAYSQENKTVTLTVSGQGQTKDEAKQNALRNAIEQAFGTFISSKTEILNDDLVKDEIVSVSNGNIQKFEIASEVQIPNGTYATTLNATVSISKLTSFVQNKGVEIEFKGSLLAANIKQQMLNETNEIKSIQSISKTCKEILDSSCDFEISNGEPKQKNNDNHSWIVPLTINVKFNKNIEQFNSHLLNSIRALSMSDNEILEYENLGKKTYKIAIANYGTAGKTNDIEELKIIHNQNDNLTYEIDGIFTYSNTNFFYSTSDVNEIIKEYKRKEKYLVNENRHEIEIKYFNKDISPIYHFRSFSTIASIIDLINYTKHSVLNFEVSNGIKVIDGDELVLDNNRISLSESNYSLSELAHLKLLVGEKERKGYNLKISTHNLTPFLKESKGRPFGPMGLFETSQRFNYDAGMNEVNSSYEPFNSEDISEFKFSRHFQPDETTKLKFGSLIHIEKELLKENSYSEYEGALNNDFQAIISLNDYKKDNTIILGFDYTDILKLNELEKIEAYKINPKSKSKF